MKYQSVRKNTKTKIKFIPTIPQAPIIVIALFFSTIPGNIAKLIRTPPINPPTWAIESIYDPIENNREKTTIMPIMQHIVDRTWPYRARAVQFMIK